MASVKHTSTNTRYGFAHNTGRSSQSLKESIVNHLHYTLARDEHTARPRDWWVSLSYAVRDRILARFIKTMDVHNQENTRRLYYLSLEYLMGRLLSNNLHNLGLFEEASEALRELGLDIDHVLDEEVDMGLGNGGLGRLAACFLDSLATLDLPAVGYGIAYEFGLFKQEFVNGRQMERADNWMQNGTPWRIGRPEYTMQVKLYGRIEALPGGGSRWQHGTTIQGLPYDIPIVGFGANTVNFLRLWESHASEDFDLATFNSGDYVEAVRSKAIGETISKVLYPNDKTENGKELRLVQQYFFCTCSLQDIIRRFRKANASWDSFPEKVAVQLNDTHPAVAVPELMRLLIDDHGLSWDRAWHICRRTFAYTNHTLLPEALEKWSVPLFERVLPRHLQIIYEINQRYLHGEVEAKWPGDNAKKRELSLIEESNPKMVRMAYLSVVGSHSVNGVAALHTELLRKNLFPDFDALYPGKFQNKTNGVTPRRWLLACNPGLARLITETLGPVGWETDLDKLRALEQYADDASFQEAYLKIKRQNKERLAMLIRERCGIHVDPAAIFDSQIKRLHEYKRQHLNLLHILALYRRLLYNPDLDIHPRVFVFGAKAAPGYDMAKGIIHAINAAAFRINNDARIKGKLKIAFIPNYGVSSAEVIIPATEVSEQISTAGKEASGTGNMKFAMNGAITIGTLDGANVEIQEEVGADNVFIFGLKVDEVEGWRASGYNPWDLYHRDEELKAIIDWLGGDFLTPQEPGSLSIVRNGLLHGGDPFFVLADFRAYSDTQAKLDAAYRDRARWARMSILNTARMGKFSTDRTMREYARDIWKLSPLPVGQ